MVDKLPTPQYIVSESYVHYNARKKKKYYIMAFIVLTIPILFLALKADYSKPTESVISDPETSLHSIKYKECLNECIGVYSEGEEMIEACRIIRKGEKTDIASRVVDECAYMGIIYVCDCMKNKNEEECKKDMLDYVNKICGM